MKVQDYIIELKRPSYLVVDLISRLMLMIAIAMFSYSIYLIHAVNWLTIVFALLVIGMIAWWIHCTRKHKKGEIVYYRLGLLLATIGWVIGYKNFGGPLWIPILYFIAVVFEKQVKFPKEIAFNEEGIIINSFPRRSYHWALLSNVVLKDCILTIDFKNNQLIQKETLEDTTVQEEKEFNEFCRTRLKANA
ncbi:MAG: hypothetical protein JWQ30_2564 [Sediminibacterium sp.]|nr:hypothetical protein [Sediminibacterium sp.]